MQKHWFPAAFLLALASASAGQSPRDTADVIFAGRFVTLDPSRPRATALAVKGGRILAVGEASSLESFAGPRTEKIDLPGVAVPGLADAHAHASGFGEQLETLDLRGALPGTIRRSDRLVRGPADHTRGETARAPGAMTIVGGRVVFRE